jgi:hypothetical protein
MLPTSAFGRSEVRTIREKARADVYSRQVPQTCASQNVCELPPGQTTGNDGSSARSGFAFRPPDPSPGPLRLVKAPAAGHPLPKGEGGIPELEFVKARRCLCHLPQQ